MSGNNNKRVYFACLGVAKCGGNLLDKVISAEVGLSRNINNIFAPGLSDAIASYADMPDVDFSYTRYLDSFEPFENEDGVNSFVGFKMAIGLDSSNNTTYGGIFSGNSTLLNGVTGSPPHSVITCSPSNLASISYSLPVDGFFTVTRNYKGFARKAGSIPTGFSESEGNVKRRQCFTGTLPTKISDNAIQNIEIVYSINRTLVPEFASRKPYASYINYPIETTITFDMLTQKLDSYVVNYLQSACKNEHIAPEDITISITDGGSITIQSAYLTNIRYSGGSANSNDSQTMSVTYTSYKSNSSIKPVITTPDTDACT